MPEPIVVDIYCQTEGRTLEDQANMEKQGKLCEAYCQEHGLTVGMVNQDSTSAWHYGNRFALTRMRQRIQSGDIQSVVVTTVDRLSQNHEHLITFMAEMGQHNVTLFTTEVKLENAE